ncbi:hypothetical protein ACFPYI_08605 [Halomarina salina]|uniref:TIGR04222 domain-containing protein n=1 Tax=Halomarina salina TaxID=1872699 RepID=A0ABD5RLV2_9EURY|nr:hypothetical protein [Halomarina salina]
MPHGPSVSVPAVDGLQEIHPVGLVAAVIGALILSFILYRLHDEARAWLLWRGPDLFGLTAPPDPIRSGSPDPVTVEDLQARLERERHWLRHTLRTDVQRRVVTPTRRQLAFYGGPFVLGLTIGEYEWPLLLAGMLAWAYYLAGRMRRLLRPMVPVVALGVLPLCLWLVGLWWLGIGVAIGSSLAVATLGTAREWWQRRQYPLTPGEECVVAVEESATHTEDGCTARTRTAASGSTSRPLPPENEHGFGLQGRSSVRATGPAPRRSRSTRRPARAGERDGGGVSPLGIGATAATPTPGRYGRGCARSDRRERARSGGWGGGVAWTGHQ